MTSVQEILKLAVGPVGGAAIGGLGLYIYEQTFCDMVKQRPWILPVLGTLAGAGAGFVLQRQFNLFG